MGHSVIYCRRKNWWKALFAKGIVEYRSRDFTVRYPKWWEFTYEQGGRKITFGALMGGGYPWWDTWHQVVIPDSPRWDYPDNSAPISAREFETILQNLNLALCEMKIPHEFISERGGPIEIKK